MFFPSLPLLVSLLLRDGGLRPRWRNRFLRFVDVLTKFVTIVISYFINRNIFSSANYVQLNMNIESMDVFNFLCIIEYIC